MKTRAFMGSRRPPGDGLGDIRGAITVRDGNRAPRPAVAGYRRRGMVLFEVMIAITVFAVAAFALVVALDTCLNAANSRNEVDLVVRGLQNQMALLNGTRIQPGETDAPDDGTGIAYHVSVGLDQNLRDEKQLPIPNTYQITITASWKMPDGTPQTKSVSEMVYQP
jgi:prepilin-type N-terminal cleavage/methylation domain-containing protein